MYSIKTVSLLCGVSRDMIRHYEKMGIIRPARDESNGYRLYSERDLNLIVMVKLYSSFGIRLKTCADIVANGDISLGRDQLRHSIRDLEWQQVCLKYRINASKRLCGAMEGYMNREPHRLLNGQDIRTFKRDEYYDMEKLSELMTAVPAFNYYYRIREAHLLGQSEGAYPSDVGVFVEGPSPGREEPGELIRRPLIFQTWLKLTAGTQVAPKHLRGIFKRIEESGHKISGDLILYQILASNDAADPADVVCVEIPVCAA